MDSEDANEMTHEDIWDDSALVDSWNEALEEYKKYHSIHSRQGKLEDLAPPETHGDGDAKTETSDDGENKHGMEETHGHGHGHETSAMMGAEGIEGAAASKDHDVPGNEDGGAAEMSEGGQQPAAATADQGPNGAVPTQALLGSVQDEGLKKLLMSWYYAGYYTGLYEGQQKQRSQDSQ